MVAAVEFRQVVKEYPTGLFQSKSLRAVNGIDLAIEPGQIFAILGPNRAGKTTLIKLLLGLAKPTAGEVFRFGIPAKQRRSLARVGYVHENHAFPKYLTARSLLHYYGALSLLPESIVQERVPQLLTRVGLSDRANEPISRFSKGMIQRLGVAQAMINEPDLLILDEPSEGLDLSGRQMIHQLAVEQKNQGKTVILVSHVLSEVEKICDRLAVIVGGQLVFSDLVKNIINDKAGQYRPLESALQEIYEQSPIS